MSQDNGTYLVVKCAGCLEQVLPKDVVTYQNKVYCPTCARKTLDEVVEQKARIKDLLKLREQIVANWVKANDKALVAAQRREQLQQDLEESSREIENLIEERQYLANKLDEVNHKLEKLGAPVVAPSGVGLAGPAPNPTPDYSPPRNNTTGDPKDFVVGGERKDLHV